MKKISLVLAIIIIIIFTACSQKQTSYDAGSHSSSQYMGLPHGIETKVAFSPLIFMGEYTGNIIKNKDGSYYEEFHVLEQYRGNCEEYILIRNVALLGDIHTKQWQFKSREKYLVLTSCVDCVYVKYYFQGCIYCPIDRFEDSLMDVLGEWVSLDYYTEGSKDNFKDYNSFLDYLMLLIDKYPLIENYIPLLYIESDDIYDILTVSPSILRVKIIKEKFHLDNYYKTYYTNYSCIVEKIYKGEYDGENGCVTLIRQNGDKEKWQVATSDTITDITMLLPSGDIDLDQTDEYIICNNGPHLVALKGIVSNDYTEEEIIQMLTEIYGEVNMIDLTEQAGNE